MPAERFYLPQTLDQGAVVSLEDNEFHHLIRVMRAEIGDEVELINGQGVLAQCKVREIKKREALLEITSLIQIPKPAREIILAQGIPRSNRLDFILEKGTELGMTQLWLFPADRSERKEFSDNQLERAQSVMASAIKQCGSLWIPQLHFKEPLKKWTALPCPAFFGDVVPDAPRLADALNGNRDNVMMFIGPESGLTEGEESKLKALGAKGVSLHPHILRTDTAAIAALALITH